jgi:hypothetical protein
MRKQRKILWSILDMLTG